MCMVWVVCVLGGRECGVDELKWAVGGRLALGQGGKESSSKGRRRFSGKAATTNVPATVWDRATGSK